MPRFRFHWPALALGLLALHPATSCAKPLTGKVVAVPGGDRLIIEAHGHRARLPLLGIKAPARGEPGRRASRDNLAGLCLGRRAMGTGDGRVLCRWRKGQWADAALYQLQEGWAQAGPLTLDAGMLASQQDAKCNRRGLWAGTFALCDAVPGAGPDTGFEGLPGSGTITYAVNGGAAEAFITISTPQGTEQHLVALPYISAAYRFEAGGFAYVSAQNQADAGSVSVAINLDGAAKLSATSSAPFGIATVSCTRGQDC